LVTLLAQHPASCHIPSLASVTYHQLAGARVAGLASLIKNHEIGVALLRTTD
jgi:hypothetical protein